MAMFDTDDRLVIKSYSSVAEGMRSRSQKRWIDAFIEMLKARYISDEAREITDHGWWRHFMHEGGVMLVSHNASTLYAK